MRVRISPQMRTSLAAFGALWLLLLAPSLAAQSPPSAAAKLQPPYVEFQFEWDQGLPWVRYTITVDQTGKTHFQGVGNAAESETAMRSRRTSR